MKKIIVYHPMRQHSFMTARALAKSGLLFQYWTSVYYDEKKVIFKIINKFLGSSNKKRLYSKKDDIIENYVKTSCTLVGLFFIMLGRISPNGFLSNFIRKKLTIWSGKRVARNAIKNGVDAIVCYDRWSYGLIKELKKRKANIKIYLDYSSLYFESILSIYDEDVKNRTHGYKFKKEIQYFKKFEREYKFEKDNSDFYISASEVVDNSLICHGVTKDKIFRATYGSYFKKQDDIKQISDITTFLYLGKLSYAKGIHYLLSAISKIDQSNFKVLLVGEDVNQFEKNSAQDSRIEYIGFIPHKDIINYLKDADVFIMPSLYDGFSLSLMEAAAYNIPSICTSNTGVSTYIEDGVNGFVIPPFDSTTLADKMLLLINDKERLLSFKQKASRLLDRLTWEKYDSQINCIFEGDKED